MRVAQCRLRALRRLVALPAVTVRLAVSKLKRLPASGHVRNARSSTAATGAAGGGTSSMHCRAQCSGQRESAATAVDAGAARSTPAMLQGAAAAEVAREEPELPPVIPQQQSNEAATV
eukprot:TRINITY_DN2431_c0_g1_i5.p1 TRINITY_DN2431_c0_g1~~TRINITY_DN2431_c0_g1_i5.p1  ORF type:complete len:118 (-),score=18.77 TRINITY_DN2431_c0_g1_i5:553-906(-)